MISVVALVMDHDIILEMFALCLYTRTCAIRNYASLVVQTVSSFLFLEVYGHPLTPVVVT
jgi:hypothetical protein